MSSTIIDDQDHTLIKYHGSWIRGGDPGAYHVTLASSTVEGDYFIVSFYGSSITVFGTIDATSGGVLTHYSVDGTPPDQVTSQARGGDTYNQQFWESGSLNVGNHELKVTMIKVNPDPVPNEGTIWFDYFKATDPGFTSAANPGPTSDTNPRPTSNTDPGPTGTTDNIPTSAVDRRSTSATDRMDTSVTDRRDTSAIDHGSTSATDPGPTSPIDPGPTSLTSPGPTNPTDNGLTIAPRPPSESNSKRHPIAEIALGGLLFLAALLTGWVILRRRRRRKKWPQNAKHGIEQFPPNSGKHPSRIQSDREWNGESMDALGILNHTLDITLGIL